MGEPQGNICSMRTPCCCSGNEEKHTEIQVKNKERAAFNHLKVLPHLRSYKAISSTLFLHKLQFHASAYGDLRRGGNFNEK